MLKPTSSLFAFYCIPASRNDAPIQEDITEYDEFKDICIENVNIDVGLLTGNDNRNILQPLKKYLLSFTPCHLRAQLF